MSTATAAPTITETVGSTPLVRLQRIVPDSHATVLLKAEPFNPMGSVKDRIAEAMIADAEAKGLLNKDTHIVEPTSGNTGIALAFVCATRGYRLTLTMPDTMSLERRAMLRSFGATLVLTPGEEGVTGAINKANEIAAADPIAWQPSQFDNPANPAIHEKTTGPEIWDATGGNVDILAVAIGTGGTFTGTSRFLRSKNPNIECVAIEPADSPVLSGGEGGPHKIMGIGAGFVPTNMDTSLINSVETVTNEDAWDMTLRLIKEEGIYAGISTGANVVGAARLAARPENAGKTIVTIWASFGERYLSTPLFEEFRD
ncbi:MAG: cysteine synthase A [Planctomycetota bacterium]|jgi:cysteine synthase A